MKPTTAQRGRGRPRKKHNPSDEINELVEQAIRGSQRAPHSISSIADSDELAEDIASAFGNAGEIAPEVTNSSNTLDVSPEQQGTPDIASSHKFPEYIYDRHAHRNGAVPLTTDAAYAMLLEDFRSDQDVELVIHKPYNFPVHTAVQNSGTGARSHEHSADMVGRDQVADSEDDSEESSSQSHFAEELAITEARESSGSDDSVLQNLPPLSSEDHGSQRPATPGH